jgi:hypothetical protein
VFFIINRSEKINESETERDISTISDHRKLANKPKTIFFEFSHLENDKCGLSDELIQGA